jgi:hypothetical protein
MPYIRQDHRFEIDAKPADVGELNFAITQLVAGWLERNGRNYTNINAAVGVLECAKLELYRRVACPYENGKKNENGDVYSKALIAGPLSIG